MISISDLTIETRRQQVLLKNISVNFGDGKLHAILGPNGSGKTTLLRTICNLIKPSGGTIRIDGREMNTLQTEELASFISWTESEHLSPFAYTAEDIIVWGRWIHHHGAPTPYDLSCCRDAAARIGILKLLDRPITTLSLGERKKVHLAKAIASGVKNLIWDEPFAPLDIRASLDTLEIAREYATQGKCVMLSVHDLTLIERYADTITILKDGQLAWHGTPSDQEFVAQLESTFDVRAYRGGQTLRFDSR